MSKIRNPNAHNERSNRSTTVQGGNFKSGNFGSDVGQTVHSTIDYQRNNTNLNAPRTLGPQSGNKFPTTVPGSKSPQVNKGARSR